MAERYRLLQSLRREVERRQEKLVWVALRAAEQGVTAEAFPDWPQPSPLAIPGGMILDFEPSVLDHYRPIIAAAGSKTPGRARAGRAKPQKPQARANGIGVDAETQWRIGLTLTSWQFEDGPRDFAVYVRVMTEDLGQIVQPYLKSWYLAIRFDPRFAGLSGFSPAAEVEAAVVEELARPRVKTRSRSASGRKANQQRSSRPAAAGGSRRQEAAPPATG
jgi:hypothetical protein